MRCMLASHRGTPLALVAILLAGSSPGRPAARCRLPPFNPLCWIEEGVDFFTDLVEDVASLAWNVFTLDPEGAYHDLIDIVENEVCFDIKLLDVIGAGVAEDLYNNSCAAPHPIAPEVLEKLRPYFKSSFTSVVIHEDCNFSNRNAITFGEHIYFGALTLPLVYAGIIPWTPAAKWMRPALRISRTNSSMSSSTGGRASPISSAATGKNVGSVQSSLEGTSGFPAGLSSRPTCMRR